MTLEQALSDEERLAQLDLGQLRQLVGLVEYDASGDPFPVSGWDALVWVVGHWVSSREQHLGRDVLTWRLAGAGLMMSAIALVLVP